MDRAMFHLAERLVTAMETMSQDVKNISTYVCDLCCSVSYLLNEKKESECISVVAHEEVGNPPSVNTSAAGQEASAKRRYSGHDGQADESSSSHIGHLEDGQSYLADFASTNIYFHGNLESEQISTEGIKTEEQTDGEVYDESCDMYDSSRNLDSDYTARMTWMAEEQAETQEMESAEDCLVRTRGNLEERPFECSMCGKSFKTGYDLQRHNRVHTGERPYKCNVCGGAFTQSGSLVLHMRSHSGERPYSCDVCLKAFRRRNHLIVHMRTHTNEKPYKCNLCGKAFRHSNSLDRHMYTHSREDPN